VVVVKSEAFERKWSRMKRFRNTEGSEVDEDLLKWF